MNEPLTDAQAAEWARNGGCSYINAMKFARQLERKLQRYEKALIRLRDCDWHISLPDRMDAVREIAREALNGEG